MNCSVCACGCVWLRWQGSLLLRFGTESLEHALECLDDILRQAAPAFSLGSGSFCACYGNDGQYYLLCSDRVSLRLSRQEAEELYWNLAAARATIMGQSGISKQRIM